MLRQTTVSVGYPPEQGDLLGRPSRLAVEVRVEGGRPISVQVSGRAVTVLSGSLRCR